MYNISLIYPLKQKKFYVNPFYIQKVCTMINGENIANLGSTDIIDVNIDQSSQLLCSNHYQLSIIDTPEGSFCELENILNKLDTDSVLLIGDTIKYGNAGELLVYFKSNFSFSFYGCPDDSAIIDFISLDSSKSSVDSVSGLMHFKQGKLVKNKVCDKHICKRFQKRPLFFTNEIIEAYETSGVQIFMEGLSHGCENRCAFCKLNNNTTISNRVHFSWIDSAKTICNLKQKCTKRLFIQFTDENFFGGGRDRLEQIIELANKLTSCGFRGALGIDTRLDTFYNSRKNLAINDLCQKAWDSLFSCGLRYCFLGLETFSESQSSRYNKNLDLSNFESTLSFLKEKGIIYTIGLILWDPLMKTTELIENLNFIKDNKLIGKTASLLKTMRVQANSQYLNQFKQKEYQSSDYFNVDDNNIEYIDRNINRILPFVNSVYKIFNDNGYRHSDVALFHVLYTEDTPIIFKEIPVKISQMEYDILEFLLQTTNISQNCDIFNIIYARCLSVVNEIITDLNQISVDEDLYAIFNYYNKVFSEIRIKLLSEINNFKKAM